VTNFEDPFNLEKVRESMIKDSLRVAALVMLMSHTGCGGSEDDEPIEMMSTTSLPAECRQEPAAVNAFGPDPDEFVGDGEIFVSIDEVWEAYSQGKKIIFLDARPPSDYVLHHIEGAISMPFYDVESCFSLLPKDVWIVAYCACPHNESVYAAEALMDEGFTKVRVLNEGYIEWRQREYPTSDQTE